jgi:hypothetical protein
MIDNGWVSTHKAMTDCLLEREAFIAQLISDNVKLQGVNDDMLEALKEIADWWVGGDCPEPLWTKIKEVIAKAEGRE